MRVKPVTRSLVEWAIRSHGITEAILKEVVLMKVVITWKSLFGTHGCSIEVEESGVKVSKIWVVWPYGSVRARAPNLGLGSTGSDSLQLQPLVTALIVAKLFIKPLLIFKTVKWKVYVLTYWLEVDIFYSRSSFNLCKNARSIYNCYILMLFEVWDMDV